MSDSLPLGSPEMDNFGTNPYSPTDLQDALDQWDRARTFDEMVDITPIVEAARRVANPDIEAARESVDMPALVLLLSRIMELAGMPIGDVMRKDLTGFAMMLRDSIVNRRVVQAALGITEDQ